MLGATDWSDLTLAGVLFAGIGLGAVITLRLAKTLADFYRGVQKRDNDTPAPTERGDT